MPAYVGNLLSLQRREKVIESLFGRRPGDEATRVSGSVSGKETELRTRIAQGGTSNAPILTSETDIHHAPRTTLGCNVVEEAYGRFKRFRGHAEFLSGETLTPKVGATVNQRKQRTQMDGLSVTY